MKECYNSQQAASKQMIGVLHHHLQLSPDFKPKVRDNALGISASAQKSCVTACCLYPNLHLEVTSFIKSFVALTAAASNEMLLVHLADLSPGQCPN